MHLSIVLIVVILYYNVRHFLIRYYWGKRLEKFYFQKGTGNFEKVDAKAFHGGIRKSDST